uniref:Uncharacterized protein n=1 Tax=Serinus canaria TaxID=9135 RepID=A0A8C9UIH9_SERCA
AVARGRRSLCQNVACCLQFTDLQYQTVQLARCNCCTDGRSAWGRLPCTGSPPQCPVEGMGKAERKPCSSVSVTRVFLPSTALLLILNSTV